MYSYAITTGLDAAASIELLNHLNKLADSNRVVVLTIHQPRLEIFHMFDRLMLLSDGKVGVVMGGASRPWWRSCTCLRLTDLASL